MTFRALLLGFVGAIFISALQMVFKITPDNVVLPFPSVTTIFPGVVSFLFVLCLMNIGLRRWRPGAALRPGELAVIYGVATVAASIAAQDEAQFLFPVYAYPFRATQLERMQPFLQFIPRWMVPPKFRDHRTLVRRTRLFLGGGTDSGVGDSSLLLDDMADRIGGDPVGMERNFTPPLGGA